jgi:hypothetical protein
MHIAAPLRRVRTPDFLLKLGRSLSGASLFPDHQVIDMAPKLV